MIWTVPVVLVLSVALLLALLRLWALSYTLKAAEENGTWWQAANEKARNDAATFRSEAYTAQYNLKAELKEANALRLKEIEKSTIAILQRDRQLHLVTEFLRRIEFGLIYDEAYNGTREGQRYRLVRAGRPVRVVRKMKDAEARS